MEAIDQALGHTREAVMNETEHPFFHQVIISKMSEDFHFGALG
jgi:hypothetical protein